MAGSILTSSFGTGITDVDYAGSNRSLHIYDKKVIHDLSMEITEIDPEEAPFLRILEVMRNKEVTGNYKYEWLEEDRKAFKTTVAGGAGVIGSNSSTDLVTAASDLYQRDDILKIIYLTAGANYGASEIVRVTSKTNATTYVVSRSASGTTATTNIAAGDEVIKIGSSHAENSVSADADSTEPVWYYNFTQNFKSAVEVSGQFDAMDVVGTKSEIMRQLKTRMRNFREEQENAFLFGERAQQGTRKFTGGVSWFVDTFAPSGNYIDATGQTFNEKWLDNNSRLFFRFGSKNKVALIGGQVMSKLAVFAKEYLRTNKEASKSLGLEVMDYVSPHGKLHFIHSRTFDESQVYAQYMMILDPKYIKKRYMKGRDTRIIMNVQPNDQDGKKHSLEADCGIEMRLPQAHFVVTELDNTIS